MVSFPPCKINLGLHVIRKRTDGFHDIETCFYPLPFTDVLEIIPAPAFGFTTSGLEIPGDPHDNLCSKAYRVLREGGLKVTEVSIHLHKIVPTGAGLGGGSADAAYTLRTLNEIFNLTISVPELERLASRLGSDCAFFIHDAPMIGTGRGEILTPAQVQLGGKYLVLLNPGIHVSTAEAFGGIVPTSCRTGIEELIKAPVSEWRHFLRNDFEQSVFARHPAIRNLKEALYEAGALYAAMSGSGSTVYGIFSNAIEASAVFEKRTVLWEGVLP
jgi:4-diphosphocytidyl-2-C-methyl-D-erythritol kinase